LPERQYCPSAIFARAPVLPVMLERQFCQSGSLPVLQERHFLYNKKNVVYYLWRVLCFATRLIREFKIYDAAGSTTRLRKKEICHARQKL
jgi:hypothetical protein